MTLIHILVFTAFSLLIRFFVPTRLRVAGLFAGSLLAVFWLQPGVPIRGLDFWFPLASIALVALTWFAVRRPDGWRNTWPGMAIMAATVLLVATTRYLSPVCCLTPTRPPPFGEVLAGLALVGLLAGLITASRRRAVNVLLTALMLALIGLFSVLKYAPASQAAAAGLRSLSGQDPSLASPLDLRWLGFSYLAFRLLHVLRDAQNRRLTEFSALEFGAYALFYPALTAGPIDRVQRFIKDLSDQPDSPWEDLAAAGQRITLGIFKKFALADTLALFALNAQNAAQANAPLWTWVLLYAYSLRIFFDFAGYTDIAIGIGRIAGVQLPENFTAPYLKTNLTAFWNSWHITLAQWFRAYFFNPLTRSLRTRPAPPPVWAVILAGQLGTMLLIGLWHGVTWNFAIWGLWHAAGLFVHNRWSDFIRPRLAARPPGSPAGRLLALGGWLLTFHYVTLGWVWFALPDPGSAASVFARLFGL